MVTRVFFGWITPLRANSEYLEIINIYKVFTSFFSAFHSPVYEMLKRNLFILNNSGKSILVEFDLPEMHLLNDFEWLVMLSFSPFTLLL